MSKKSQKLVRDNIPDIIKNSGQIPKTRILENDEYILELIKKLKEETEEFEEAYSPEELADILELVLALCSAISISEEELEELRNKKAQLNGAFKNKIFLESIE